ncbi:MAG: MopE-related protein [Myxococcota bacterium]
MQEADDCVQILGITTFGGDCDDSELRLSPAQPGVCDGIDNKCYGFVEDAAARYWYADNERIQRRTESGAEGD